MQIPVSTRKQLESLIDQYGLPAAWKGVLAARIRTSGEQFSYMLQSRELYDGALVLNDPLLGLSVGEISVLYEYSLAYYDRVNRKLDGQYFTPDDVSRFLVSHGSVFPENIVWVDPCSGVGNLAYWLTEKQDDKETFLQKNLYLIDLDPLALLISRVFFTIAFQKTEQRLFTKLGSRFLERNFLKADDLPKFDAAILNPPYVSGVLDRSFRTVEARNTYAYFLERVAGLCHEGYISITPQTFTNGSRFGSLRDFLIESHSVLDVYCFDNVPDNVFSGIKFGSNNTNKANSTRAGVIIARSGKEKLHRITPLLRWRSHEREHMFATAHQFLTEVTFTPDVFPKIGRELKSLYEKVRTFDDKLGNLTVSQPTPYLLQVPTTPRYFISANKNPVQRTSYRFLYFKSERDLDCAYVLLNSSYMYWWWRVNDGGMTISEKTLLDLPIPANINRLKAKRFVKMLEASEVTSKVVKLNAGKAVENIKHSFDLTRLITEFLFPSYVTFLSDTHSNSNVRSTITEGQLGLAI